MSRGLVFWILMLLWLIFGVWTGYPSYIAIGGTLLVFLLFVLVGWQVFGPPIHG